MITYVDTGFGCSVVASAARQRTSTTEETVRIILTGQ